MLYKIYKKTVRPILNRIKKFKNFLRDMCICLWRGWDLRLLTACDLNLSKIPSTTELRHPIGIVISSKAVIGEYCSIRQNVTIGLRDEKEKEYPVLGDRVCVGAGALILGGVRVGDQAVIGAGAIVLEDVPARSNYLCRLQPIIKLRDTD